MDVFVTGGSGYVGGYVLRALSASGHRVKALVRSEASAQRVRALGASAVSGDVAAAGPWQEHALESDAILHLACPSPRAERKPYEWAPFSQTWVHSVAAFEERALPLLFACARGSSRCRILVTTTGPAAAGDHGDRWIDESARGPASSFGRVQQMIEDRTLEAARSGVPAMVIRPGAVYGPDGGFAARVLRDAARGRVLHVGSGSNYISWVHIEDYAATYVLALAGAAAGKVVTVVDDHPATARASMELLAELTGVTRVHRVPRVIARIVAGPVVFGWATQSARARNLRARELLGFQPRYPSLRDGLVDVLARAPAPVGVGTRSCVRSA